MAASSLGAAPAGGGLAGNVYDKPWPAADFTLTDQNGEKFHMADTLGKVVVLSFIYTHCTDFCPFVALKLKAARALLGPDAEKAVLLVVTTDPLRDTPKVLAEYTMAMGMEKSWHFVTGRLSAMRQVWKDYFIGVEIEKESPGTAPAKPDPAAEEEARKVAKGLTSEERSLAGSIIDQFGGGYGVSHDIPFWFVDPRGMMRVSLDADATPQDIAKDIQVLLQE
jgi:cytochrome oxidase Cu insertion factor (SCO1/SenC/PrrC family)